MGSRQVVVVGGAATGKTRLLRQVHQQLGGAELCPRAVSDEYVPSAGAELLKLTLAQQSGSPVQLDVFDTPGEERWRALCDGYVSQAHGLVVVLEVFVDPDDSDRAVRSDLVHAPSLAAARSWLGHSVPTLLLALRTPIRSARPDLERQEVPRSENNPKSLTAQARASGAICMYTESGASGAMGVEAALLGLVAAIDAERSRHVHGTTQVSPRQAAPPLAPTSTVSSGSNTSMNDSGEVQRLLAGIGGVLDTDSSVDSIESPSTATATVLPGLALPSRGSIFARFERHAGPGSQMNAEQFHALAEELWPGAEGLNDSVNHAIAAAATTWPLERHGVKPLLQLVAGIDQLATAVGRHQGCLPSSLSVGDFTTGVRATGKAISDADAVGEFMKLGGAGGYADIEEVIAWLARSCSVSNSSVSSRGSPAPPVSPRDGAVWIVDDDGDTEEDEGVTIGTRHPAWATQTNAANAAAEKDAQTIGKPRSRLSIKDQDELMSKLEADPDNMDLLMQLQELHRSLSMELDAEDTVEEDSTAAKEKADDLPASQEDTGRSHAVSKAAALDALLASEDQLRGLITTAKLLEDEVDSGADEHATHDLDGATSISSAVPTASPHSMPSTESAERMLRGAGGRRTSWASGSSAEAATAVVQFSEASAAQNATSVPVADYHTVEQGQAQGQEQQQQKQRSPPSRRKRSLFSRARSTSRNRANVAGKSLAPATGSVSEGSAEVLIAGQQLSEESVTSSPRNAQSPRTGRADAGTRNENEEPTSRSEWICDNPSDTISDGISGTSRLDDTGSAAFTKSVSAERVEQLTAMREQMTSLLEQEREHRKLTTTQLNIGSSIGECPRMSTEHTTGGKVSVTVRAGPQRIAQLARHSSPQRMRVRRSEAKGFGSSSPARVRKASRGGPGAADARRATNPASVPRVATLASAAAAEVPKPRAHPNGPKKGFGTSGCRDTSPAVWNSSVNGTIPTACSPKINAQKQGEDPRSPKGDGRTATNARMKPAAKAALRWMKSPTKSSAAKHVRAAATASAPAAGATGRKGFGSSASRGVGGSAQMVHRQRHSEMQSRNEPLSDKVADLVNRLVPPNNSGDGSTSPVKNRRTKYKSPAKRGFGTSSPARLTNAWLAQQELQASRSPATESAEVDSSKSIISELTAYETVDDWGHGLSSDAADEKNYEEPQDEDWGQRETEDALDPEEEQAKKSWNETAQAEKLLEEARQREKMAELHTVQKRLIVEIEQDPDNLSLLQHLAQVDKAMALAISAGASPPSGRSPAQAPTRQQNESSRPAENAPESPSRVERARRAAAQLEREDAKRQIAEHRQQREMQRLEKARKDAERREIERQRNHPTKTGSRVGGLSRLLRPKSASDNMKAVERRQKRIVQVKEEAQKDLTFQPLVPKGAVILRHRQAEHQHQHQQHQDGHAKGSATDEQKISREESSPSKSRDDTGPELKQELEAVSDRLYRECAERAQRRSTREEQQQAQELAGCTFSPNISVSVQRLDILSTGSSVPETSSPAGGAANGAVSVVRRLDLDDAGRSDVVGAKYGSQANNPTKQKFPGRAFPEGNIYSRIFDIVDADGSGQVSSRQMKGFCAAMLNGAHAGDADVKTAKACSAAIMGTCIAVANVTGSAESITKQQFVQTSPGNAVLSKITPHYDNVISFCHTLASDETRTGRYLKLGAQMSDSDIEDARCEAVGSGKQEVSFREVAATPAEPDPEKSDGLRSSQSSTQDVVSRARTWQADRQMKLADRRAALLRLQEEEEKAMYKPFKANPVPPPPPCPPTEEAAGAPTPPVRRKATKVNRLSQRLSSPKRRPEGSADASSATDLKHRASTHGRHGQQRNRSPAQQRKAAAKLSGLEPSKPTLRQRRFLAEAAAAVSSTPRSPGKTGPIRHAARHSRSRGVAENSHSRGSGVGTGGRRREGRPAESVLRRPSDASGFGAADDQNLPSPEAEIDQDDDHEYHVLVSHLSQGAHGCSDEDQETNSNELSIPPPSPTPTYGERTILRVAAEQQGYRVTADVDADTGSHTDDFGAADGRGEAAKVEDESPRIALSSRAEQDDEQSASDGESATVLAEADVDRGGGRLVQEV